MSVVRYRPPEENRGARLFLLLALAGAGWLGLRALDLDPWALWWLDRLSDAPAVTTPQGTEDAAEGDVRRATDEIAPDAVTVVELPETPLIGTATAVKVDVPIGLGFSPVGFRIAAVSHPLSLSDRPHELMRRLPRFEGSRQRFGFLALNRGQSFGLAFDQGRDGIRLYLDRNRNGDLRDDGPPLANEGDGLFAARLELDLAQVSGVPRLEGSYGLWLFLDEVGWGEGRGRHYALTQLQGRILLNGASYDAWLADNGVLDGDYANDGLYLDLDRDGRIDPAREHIPPGEALNLDGRLYRFSIHP